MPFFKGWFGIFKSDQLYMFSLQQDFLMVSVSLFFWLFLLLSSFSFSIFIRFYIYTRSRAYFQSSFTFIKNQVNRCVYLNKTAKNICYINKVNIIGNAVFMLDCFWWIYGFFDGLLLLHLGKFFLSNNFIVNFNNFLCMHTHTHIHTYTYYLHVFTHKQPI